MLSLPCTNIRLMATAILLKDILLAEDDQDDVEIFEEALRDLAIPYELRHAENGDMLFILLRDRLPYILFLDIHMPCKDGIACIIEIRKNREYDKVPVIMYTSNYSRRVVEECFRNGANMFLGKTNTYSSLVEKLRKVFSIDWGDYLHYPPESHFEV